MANNLSLAVSMIGTSEALAMGEAHGLDPAILSDIMKASSGNNWSLQVYNPWPDVMEGVPSSNNYQPGFMVDLMVKRFGTGSGCRRRQGQRSATIDIDIDLEVII